MGRSGRLSKSQVVVYAGLGVVLLLLGVRALRGADAADPSTGSGGIEVATEPVGSGGPGPADGDLVVHVAGAVEEPGVYRLPVGSRVGQALERAGGPSRKAEPNAINLAARLSDGQQVVVPSRRPVAASAAGEAAADGLISFGSASAADLEQIDGIGPITAEKLIAFRDEQGGIGAIEELDAVPGIGPATIESLSARLQP
jgi:competence protein ComEA